MFSFIEVLEPNKADAAGLVQCLCKALNSMGTETLFDKEKVLAVMEHPVLVGVGTDGAAVNISDQNGMKGMLQASLPWLFWSWCFAHRLELACHDALSSQLFRDLDEMLLRIYYLYEKSPKKCRELSHIVSDLREVYQLPDGGDRPVRATGSRWISHKRKALQRFMDRYGPYIAHLITLVEDKTLKSSDRQRLKGYLLKWTNGRILMGCALYTGILRPVSLLSQTLQEDHVDVAKAVRVVLKAHSSLQRLSTTDPLEWPTTKAIGQKIQITEEGLKTYQGMELKNFSDTIAQSCMRHALEVLKTLDSAIRDRVVRHRLSSFSTYVPWH